MRGARVAFGLLSALAFAGPAAAMNGSFENAATRIQVRLVERLSAQNATAGDVFRFETTSSVMIAGRFFPAETRGHGVVVAAHPSRGQQPGRLVLAARSLDPATGDPVEVGLEPGELSRTLAYEKGTLFFVEAPPPATPAPLPEGTGS